MLANESGPGTATTVHHIQDSDAGKFRSAKLCSENPDLRTYNTKASFSCYAADTSYV